MLVGAIASRSPYGERGLKYRGGTGTGEVSTSLSLRRAWIEISLEEAQTLSAAKSLSLRRAWIEIARRQCSSGSPGRSPYGERGLKYKSVPDYRLMRKVALLTESVD